MTYATAIRDPRWMGGIAAEARTEVTTPEVAHDLLRSLAWPDDREACWALMLDRKNRLLDAELVSVGSLDHTFMAPREVYRAALLAGAASLIVAHSHPSGDATPSADDEAITRRLSQAGELIGIDLLDHLVLGDGRWTSLARRGALD